MTKAGTVNYTWDNNGNLTNDGSAAYLYDRANRLISTTLGGVTTQFTYNGDGVRLKQIIAGTPTTYTQDLAAPLPVVLQSKTGVTTTKYLYSLGTRPLAQNGGTWEYLLPDALGSVRQIADANGNVTLAESYEPYGSVLNSSGSATSIFGYAGEQFDTTGLIYLRARYLQPTLGIFLSRDPWMGYDEMPVTYNGFNYATGNPINQSDPGGLQAFGWEGPLYLVQCLDLHTVRPFSGIQEEGSATARQAVATCKAAYSNANWNKHASVVGFQLGQDLPTTGHELFGWFLFDWRGKFNSDRLFFDGTQALTQELVKSSTINDVREMYYNGDSRVGGPTEYPFDEIPQIWAFLDSSKSIENGSFSISMFIGSFWYQIKTLPNDPDRVGFRIDNDTTLSSGTHIALRHNLCQSVEELIESYPILKNKPLDQLIPENPQLISILRNRTREETRGQGGGNLYQTYTWTEKRDCSWLSRRLGLSDRDVQIWPYFWNMTMDPPGFPPY